MSCTTASTDGSCAAAAGTTGGGIYAAIAELAFRLASSSTAEHGPVTPELARLVAVLFAIAVVSGSAAAYLLNKNWNLWRDVRLTIEGLFDRVPDISDLVNLPRANDGAGGQQNGSSSDPSSCRQLVDPANPTLLQCFNPSNLNKLGDVPNLTAKQVNDMCLRAKSAQQSWKETTFAQRRRVLRTHQRYVVSHIDEICQLCSLDSGKTQVDALLGEILTTCEKIRTLLHHGETWLERSPRDVNPMMLHKTAYVEYVPLGVLGIIAPW